MNYQFTRYSSNIKTGRIPTTMTEKASCPTTCPYRGNGCYAENFPLSLHWNKVTGNGIDINELASNLGTVPKGQLWRHNVAGDLPLTHDGVIDTVALAPMLKINVKNNLKGFTYTHHSKTLDNVFKIKAMASLGFTVNLSYDSIDQLNACSLEGVAKVVVVPSEVKEKQWTSEAGHNIVVCPATYKDDTVCENCGLCAESKRQCVVAFPVHGTKKKKANLIAIGY